MGNVTIQTQENLDMFLAMVVTLNHDFRVKQVMIEANNGFRPCIAVKVYKTKKLDKNNKVYQTMMMFNNHFDIVVKKLAAM